MLDSWSENSSHYLHHYDDPKDGEWPVTNAILIVEVSSESEHSMTQDHEEHEAAREDESIGPHTVLVDQDVGIHG